MTAKEGKGRNLFILCSVGAVSHDTDSLPSNCRHKGLRGGQEGRTHGTTIGQVAVSIVSHGSLS